MKLSSILLFLVASEKNAPKFLPHNLNSSWVFNKGNPKHPFCVPVYELSQSSLLRYEEMGVSVLILSSFVSYLHLPISEVIQRALFSLKANATIFLIVFLFRSHFLPKISSSVTQIQSIIHCLQIRPPIWKHKTIMKGNMCQTGKFLVLSPISYETFDKSPGASIS